MFFIGFEFQIVSTALLGDETMPGGLPFVVKSDLDIVAFNKEPLALCAFLRRLVCEQGLADFELEFHVCLGKCHPAAPCFQFSSFCLCRFLSQTIVEVSFGFIGFHHSLTA